MVQVYDYVDVYVPTLMRMYNKRVKGYEAIGYLMQGDRENSCKEAAEYQYVLGEKGQ